MYPRPVRRISNIVTCTVIAHIDDRIGSIHMATAYFQIISIWSRLRICNNYYTTVPGKVRFDDISRIILVGCKVTLNVAALIKVLGSYTIVNA